MQVQYSDGGVGDVSTKESVRLFHDFAAVGGDDQTKTDLIKDEKPSHAQDWIDVEDESMGAHVDHGVGSVGCAHWNNVKSPKSCGYGTVLDGTHRA